MSRGDFWQSESISPLETLLLLISTHHRRYSVKVWVRCRYPSWLAHMSLSPDLRQTLGHGNDLLLGQASLHTSPVLSTAFCWAWGLNTPPWSGSPLSYYHQGPFLKS